MRNEDSSSDDEPMLSSPEPSEDEKDSDDEDVFKFTAHKFQKAEPNEIPLSRGGTMRRRRHNTPSLEEKLHQMEQTETFRGKNLLDRIAGKGDSDHSDDGDSDKESGGINKCNGTKSTSATILPRVDVTTTCLLSTRSYAMASAHSKYHDTVDLLDSDSDDDTYTTQVPISCLKGASKEALDVLQRSRMATYHLKQAQHYHAEDIHVQVQSPPRPVLQAQSTPKPLIPHFKAIQAGKTLRLTCRTRLEINGKKQSTEDQIYSIRENEPFSLLVDKLARSHSLSSTARIVIQFDGMSLEPNQTAAFYEIEDQDLIDVSAKVFVMPFKPLTNTKSMGPKTKLTLRRKAGKTLHESSIQLGFNDTFQRHLDDYKRLNSLVGRYTFRFDGEMLDCQRTPAHYEMETGDLIDVIVS